MVPARNVSPQMAPSRTPRHHRLGRLLRSGAYVATGLPVATVTFVVVVVGLSVTAGLAVTLLLALPSAWFLFVSSRVLAALERNRVAALLGIEVDDPVPPLTRPTWFGRLAERARCGARWREMAHHLLLLPVASAAFAACTAAWCGSATLLVLPAIVSHLPGRTAKFHLFEIGPGWAAWGAAGVGAVGLLVIAPQLTWWSAQAEGFLARKLLGRSGEAVLAEQVVQAEGRRSAAVDSAEAERRRIERDLHDGAQQRLVALAAGLGAAKAKLDDDPEAGKAMVATAHEEAKAALKDIRDLVRGIHPVILEDRGLDAALSAVVARAPVPVTLDVQVQPRPPAAVESAAYFVVNEALTNVARHAHATRAHIGIARAGDRLVVEVRDDGVGGADASRGSGLQGLRERVTGLGGDLHVISPAGGPTTISVELPCGS